MSENPPILLLSLDQDQAAEILKRLPPEAVEEVSREIASLGEISRRPRARTSSASSTTSRWPTRYLSEGGLEYAKALLRKVAQRRRRRARHQAGHAAGRRRRRSRFLQKAEIGEPADVHPGRAPADDRADPRAPAAAEGERDPRRPARARSRSRSSSASPTWSRRTRR